MQAALYHSLASFGASMTSSLRDFEKLEIIGRGSFGIVYKVRRRVDGLIYVLKQIPVASLDLQAQQVTTMKLERSFNNISRFRLL